MDAEIPDLGHSINFITWIEMVWIYHPDEFRRRYITTEMKLSPIQMERHGHKTRGSMWNLMWEIILDGRDKRPKPDWCGRMMHDYDQYAVLNLDNRVLLVDFSGAYQSEIDFCIHSRPTPSE